MRSLMDQPDVHGPTKFGLGIIRVRVPIAPGVSEEIAGDSN